MNGVVSKVNKKSISHLIRAKPTPSEAATVQVSRALPAVRFSCLLRGQFPRWRRSRKRLSMCSVLRCPDLWLQCSVSFVHGLENRAQQLVPSTTELSFVCFSQFACKKKLLMTFGTTLVNVGRRASKVKMHNHASKDVDEKLKNLQKWQKKVPALEMLG